MYRSSHTELICFYDDKNNFWLNTYQFSMSIIFIQKCCTHPGRVQVKQWHVNTQRLCSYTIDTHIILYTNLCGSLTGPFGWQSCGGGSLCRKNKTRHDGAPPPRRRSIILRPGAGVCLANACQCVGSRIILPTRLFIIII